MDRRRFFDRSRGVHVEELERIAETFSSDVRNVRAGSFAVVIAFNKRLQKRVCKSLILRGRFPARNRGQETNDFRTRKGKIFHCPSLFT